MNTPFAQLVGMIDALDERESQATLGELAERWGVPAVRIMDAVDASKTLRGIANDLRAEIHHAADNGHVLTGQGIGPGDVVPGVRASSIEAVLTSWSL